MEGGNPEAFGAATDEGVGRAKGLPLVPAGRGVEKVLIVFLSGKSRSDVEAGGTWKQFWQHTGGSFFQSMMKLHLRGWFCEHNTYIARVP